MKPRLASGRWLALFILLCFIGAIVAGVAYPLWNRFHETEAEIAFLKENIGKFERISNRLPLMRKALETLPEQGGLSRLTLSEPSTALAAAALQERVKDLVAQHGGGLVSTQVQPVLDVGDFRRVTVAVRFNAGTAGAQRILYALEVGEPLLRVHNLTIISRSRPGAEARPGQYLLDVRLELSGYLFDSREDEGTS